MIERRGERTKSGHGWAGLGWAGLGWAGLGWEPGIFNGPGWRKLKGMHWRTYERLVTEAEKWTALSVAGMTRRFGIGPEEW